MEVPSLSVNTEVAYIVLKGVLIFKCTAGGSKRNAKSNDLFCTYILMSMKIILSYCMSFKQFHFVLYLPRLGYRFCIPERSSKWVLVII